MKYEITPSRSRALTPAMVMGMHAKGLLAGLRANPEPAYCFTPGSVGDDELHGPLAHY